MGISAILLTIYGAAMKFLAGRKAALEINKLRLEIGHIKTDTEKLQLEVQKLNEEKEQRDAVKLLQGLSARILESARQKRVKNRNSDAVIFTEQELSELLSESLEVVGRALLILHGERGQNVRFDSSHHVWILDV